MVCTVVPTDNPDGALPLEPAVTVVGVDVFVVVGVDVVGGITRSQSVINGIKALEKKKNDYERLVILEAARPLVTKDQLETILNDDHSSTTYALGSDNAKIATITVKNPAKYRKECEVMYETKA